MKHTVRLLAATLILLTLCAACAFAEPAGFAMDLKYKQADGAVDILRGTQVVARYVYNDTPRPFIHPILSPAGLAVTRNYPMKEVAGEPIDHPHHRSMWIGFGDINGADFWTDGEKSGKIVQKSIAFDPVSVDPYWSIHTTNDWLLADGKKLLSDERKVAFYSCQYGLLIVTALTLNASECDLTFGDSKEGFFAMRVAPSIALKDGKGHILNSEGKKDADAWGQRARWVDYTGEVGGKTVGITMFDSHYNFGYPTYWHARDYGLLAANPFGGKAFSGDAENESKFSIGYTSSAKFIYVVLIHDGKLGAATINELADEVVGRPTTEAPPVIGADGKAVQPSMKSDEPVKAKPEPARIAPKPEEPKAKPTEKKESTD